MATKRRPSVPRYRDGGAVPLSSPAAENEQQEVTASADEPPQSPPADDNAVARAVAGMLQAENMQRQAAAPPPPSHEDIISRMAISEAKKQFLRQRPEMLRPDYAEITREAHGAGLEFGLIDDSPEMFDYLAATVTNEMQARRQRLADAARAAADVMVMPPPRAVDPIVDLDAEASAIQSAHVASESAADVLASRLPQPEPTPRSSRMPMTAPVSRGDVPSLSGDRRRPDMTLSPEERAIARNSFTDPNMSNAQKESLYLQNRIKLQRMRQAGLYPERERG